VVAWVIAPVEPVSVTREAVAKAGAMEVRERSEVWAVAVAG